MKIPNSNFIYIITDEQNQPLINKNGSISFFRSISETQFICDVLNDILPSIYKPTYSLMIYNYNE